ncbi:DUF1840 domain-containing protein [Paraburkholderia sp. ZP32-5]|uniref:DUF1840 domain-containing protein n=1 Tax=Paraburkholderia sp. ZP32-5 TaxID=2883245 RepID=UPI001F25338B|nr:DUF1840 domain-containing protein [Paraburkholderia sp. ZP32-5]
MPVTFQSAATADVQLLTELAQYLLGLLGKRLDKRGVIQHDKLPLAISRIEQAISNEEKAEIAEDALNCIAQAASRERGSGLAQRARPLLDMMREAELRQADISWAI